MSTDVMQHTEQLTGWQFQYDQLDRGRFEGRFLDVRLPGMQLFMEFTNRHLRQHGTLTPGCVSVATMLSGQGSITINGMRPQPNGLALVHGSELELISPADCTIVGIVVDAPLLKQAAPALRRRLCLASVSKLRTGGDHDVKLLESIQRILLLAFSEPARLEDAAVRRSMRDDVLALLVDALTEERDADVGSHDSARSRLVARACQLMLSGTDSHASLNDVCKTLGISLRKLNYCFQEMVSMSPARYGRTLRLNAARRELVRPADSTCTVHEVAVRWGFQHFGRFSCDYKRQFCESPSESLCRARLRRSPS